MSYAFIALAYADHGAGATRSAPLGPLAAGLLWAGIAALAVLVVFAVIAILTRRPRGSEDDADDRGPGAS